MLARARESRDLPDPALSRPIHPTPTADPVCPALTTDPDDAALALTLQHSAKDRAEHALAVVSVIEVLAPHIVDLRVDPEPFALRLPNVWHLATDLSGRLADESTVLDLVAKLHPTAAVGGTPTAAAIAAITDLESFDRGRYAGPVGWIDATGDGEWAVAIRCAQVDPDGTVTAYAGCGVVAASDPATELTETDWKFGPIRAAFAPVTDVPSRNTTQG